MWNTQMEDPWIVPKECQDWQTDDRCPQNCTRTGRLPVTGGKKMSNLGRDTSSLRHARLRCHPETPFPRTITDPLPDAALEKPGQYA